MKPYATKRNTKGISGRRRSCDTPHRRRCLRTDKKAMRRIAKNLQQIEAPQESHDIIRDYFWELL